MTSPQLTQEMNLPLATNGSSGKGDTSRERSQKCPDFGVKKKQTKQKPDMDPGLQGNKQFYLGSFQWELRV